MKAKYKMAIAVWLSIIAIFYLVTSNRTAGAVANIIVRIALLTVIIGGSVYKLALWFRYRNDPEKREAVAFSIRTYPKRIRKFLMDEQDETKTPSR